MRMRTGDPATIQHQTARPSHPLGQIPSFHQHLDMQTAGCAVGQLHDRGADPWREEHCCGWADAAAEERDASEGVHHPKRRVGPRSQAIQAPRQAGSTGCTASGQAAAIGTGCFSGCLMNGSARIATKFSTGTKLLRRILLTQGHFKEPQGCFKLQKMLTQMMKHRIMSVARAKSFSCPATQAAPAALQYFPAKASTQRLASQPAVELAARSVCPNGLHHQRHSCAPTKDGSPSLPGKTPFQAT